MNGLFSSIMDLHETEDARTVRSEREIRAAAEREFSNADELFAAAEKVGISGTDIFRSPEVLSEIPVLPVRRADAFGIKKHTCAQVPYMHGHEFYELICVCRGKCTQHFADGAETVVGSRKICLIPPGTIHSLGRSGKGDVILKMTIPVPLYEETGRDAVGTPPSPVTFDASDTCEFLVYRLLSEDSYRRNMYALAVRGLLMQLFAELSRPATDHGRSVREKLRGYLERDISRASLAGFARECGYSTGHAGRMIRSGTGMSFTDAVSGYRMTEGARLLAETTMPVDDIAVSLGYANASGFYKSFCAHYGMTPGEYRRMNMS